MFVLVCLQLSVFAQSDEKNQIAKMSGGGSNVRWDVTVPYSSGTITIITPDGEVVRKDFGAGAAADVALTDARGEKFPDGVYTYEIRVAPVFAPGLKEALAKARANGNGEAVQRDLRKRGLLPTQLPVQSGSFSILNGSVIAPGALEETAGRPQARNTVEREYMFIVKPPETLWERGLEYEGKALPEGFRYSSDSNSQWLDMEGIREFVAPFEQLFAEGRLEG